MNELPLMKNPTNEWLYKWKATNLFVYLLNRKRMNEWSSLYTQGRASWEHWLLSIDADTESGDSTMKH